MYYNKYPFSVRQYCSFNIPNSPLRKKRSSDLDFGSATTYIEISNDQTGDRDQNVGQNVNKNEGECFMYSILKLLKTNIHHSLDGFHRNEN